ncbi:transglutaminase domain-containing protein [uncultured Bacteroides sp.]|uniref:transglutaminase domain-containing protein n=1 Tax=uncultured Bacteroides sp. TaxID=162156 RepID=UPI00261A1625|nr:transglutaminase domain-containing protein [uncultured Bacteroides sp.]
MSHYSNNKLTAWVIGIFLLLPFGQSLSARQTTRKDSPILPAPPAIVQTAEHLPTEQLTFPDSVALSVPETAEHSVASLVAYMKQHLKTEEQLARAIYTWVSRNIQYNVYITYTPKYEEIDEKKEIQKILSERKGVCQQYTLLFKAMLQEAGIDAHTINGYNRQNGVLLPDPHQWCAARMNGNWYMFDPTWGAGFVEDYKFVPSPNYRYYKQLSDSLLKTHMPFDPMFQFRERPLTYEEFDTGTFDEQKPMPVFYWRDSLELYARQDTLQQLTRALQRMQTNGKGNDLVRYTLELTKQNIRVAEIQQVLTAYNTAMNLLREAADGINLFIQYRNKAFIPKKNDNDIQLMVDMPESMITRADSCINSIRSVPDRYRKQMLELREQIMEVATTIYKHKLFLRQYFKLPEKKRKDLFKQTK